MILYEKEPLVIKSSVPAGNYEVTLYIKAHSDTFYTVFIQDSQFITHKREIKNGEEQALTFIASVHDKLFKGGNMYKPEGLIITIATDGDITATSHISPVDIPTLYVIGDSTVTNQPSFFPYNPEEIYCGVAQPLGMFVDTKIAVSNHAESGATTQDAIDMHIKAFDKDIKKGDFLMIEFGHNDQKIAELSAFGGYSDNLRFLINWAREHGATPIVNSPINRIIFDEDGSVFDLLGNNKKAAEKIANETDAPFIDMWSAVTDFITPLGLYTSKRFFRHDNESQDYTHPNILGGMIFSKMLANLLHDANIDGLSEHITPQVIDKVKIPENAPFESNAFEFKRLKTLGVGDAIDDIDDDITNLGK